MFDLAIWYRAVGGFMGLGSTNLARLRFLLQMACYMAFVSIVHHEDFLAVLIVFGATTATTFLGRLISHSRFQSVASITNSIGMAVINVIRLALIVAPYAFSYLAVGGQLHFWRLFLPLFGIMASIAYYVGNKWLHGKDSGIYWRNTHTQWRINPQTDVPTSVPVDPSNILDQAAVGGSEWGELLTGWLGYELMYLTALVMP